MARRLDSFLRGPHLRLPRPLDACSEWWSGKPPRVRMLLAALAVVAAGAVLDARVRAVDDRWGGVPQTVLVATRDLSVGDPVDAVRAVRLPPHAVPPEALSTVGSGAVLALALPEGSVLTSRHVNARGPAAGLDTGLRAVPVPAEEGWGVVEGGWVDVWTLGSGEQPSRLVARARPVLDVREDASGMTALVGLADREVSAVTTGLALGRVLLAHAPPPASAPR